MADPSMTDSSMAHSSTDSTLVDLLAPAQVLAVGGLNRIPEGVSFAEASVAEPLACVINGQELARVGKGDDVVVLGAGPIGCLHVRLARASGANRVLLVDLNPDRLAQAAEGAAPDAAIRPAPDDPVAAVRPHPRGLHARPARIFVKAAAALPVDVLLAVDGKKPVKAGSMLGVLALGAVQGTKVVLSAEDDAAGAGRAAVDELATLL